MINKKQFISLILSFVIVLSMSINIAVSNDTVFFRYTNFNVFYLLIFICLYKFLIKRKSKFIFSVFILSIIMSIINVSCYYLGEFETISKMFDSRIQLLKTFICIIGWGLIYYFLIEYLFVNLKKFRPINIKNQTLEFVLNKHPMLFSFIFLIICYIPVLIIGYPGIISGDGMDELKQFDHVRTWSLNYINLINPSVYINGHHSPFHTFFIGFIFNLFNSHRIGLFVNVMIQMLLQVFVLSYTMKLLKKLKTHYVLRMIILVCFTFLPFFNFSAISIYKDVPFSIMCLLYTDLLIEYFYLKENSNCKLFLLIVVSLLVMFLTNKGVYVVLVTTIVILFRVFLLKKNVKKLFAVFVLPILVYFGISKIVFPMLYVTPGSIQEMLSLSIQQVSRYVVYHENDLNDNDREVISGLLVYKDIKKKYDSRISDPIKNHFNKDYTNEQIKDFMILYLKLFSKHPGVYISAFANQTYKCFDFGYYGGLAYFETAPSIHTPYNLYGDLELANPNYMLFLKKVYFNMRYIPVIGIVFNLALYFWLFIVLLLKLFLDKKRNFVLPLVPTFVLVLFLFVSPVGGNKRYFLPIIYDMSIIIPYVIWVLNNEAKKY